MPKKKPPKNAFSFYLDEAITELRGKGEVINSKAHAAQLISPKWAAMTAAQKAPYQEKAMQHKMMSRGVPRVGRLDCTGHRISDRVDTDKIILDERKEQKKFLLQRWQEMRNSEIKEEIFYFVSFQSFFECPNEEGYQPCEIAVVEYSLAHGITKKFHAMINPGKVKLGMAAEAKLFSEATHKIPTFDYDFGRKDHAVLWNELLEFVNPGYKRKVFPPLFTKLSELKKTTACLDHLASLAGKSNQLKKVYQWEGLAVTLYEQAGMQPPSMSIIEHGAASSMYDYEKDTKCSYHDELECVHCAMLVIKKCCYWLSDAFMKIYDFEITEAHLPVRSAPQYSVIDPEDFVINTRARRRFRGSECMPSYDPNLPASYQNDALGELMLSESSACSSIFSSKDIRYRKNYLPMNNPDGRGRGMALSSRIQSTVQIPNDVSDTASAADTDDDVESIILGTDSVTDLADDEKSVASCLPGGEIRRAQPKTKPKCESNTLFAHLNENTITSKADASNVAGNSTVNICSEDCNDANQLLSNDLHQQLGELKVEETTSIRQDCDFENTDQILNSTVKLPFLPASIGRGRLLQRHQLKSTQSRVRQNFYD